MRPSNAPELPAAGPPVSGPAGDPARLALPRSSIERTIPERWDAVVRAQPDRPALTGNGRRWTYAGLDGEADLLARAIGRAAPGDPGCVAFLVPQSPEMVLAALAILKAGRCYLGLHPGLPLAAQQNVVRDARPQLLLATAGLAGRAREVAGTVCPVMSLEEASRLTVAGEPPAPVQDPGSPCAVFYTSGTSGRPKGVVKSHRAVLHRVWLSTLFDAVAPEDRQSLLTHASFAASEADIFATLLQGGTVCVFDLLSEGMAEFSDWIRREEITLLHPPVLFFRRFLATLEEGETFPSVRGVALAGDVVLPADLERWRRHFAPSCVLWHRFSATETALLAVSCITAGESRGPEDRLGGRAVPDKDLEIAGPSGEPVLAGEEGELVVRSAYLADGYWRRPDETAAAFVPDPQRPERRVYRTGDRARLAPDGSLIFLGRRDGQVKIRGFRVELGEVEAAFLTEAEVAEAAVVARRDEGGVRLAAFVVPRPGAVLEEKALRQRLRARLAEWQIPATIQVLPALPVTLTGKVDRRSLTAGGEESGEEKAAACGSLEDRLTEIWRSALRCEAVGPEDHFIDLGGDSLVALQVLNRMQRELGVQMSLEEFFRHGTVQRLAAAGRSSGEPSGADSPPSPAGPPETVADAYLSLLVSLGVTRIFVNPGTDTAPILEAFVRRKALGQGGLELVQCLHESVALAAAHGHYLVSGRPQVVLVHVDVGTQNLGANLHNAQRDRAGVILCAGRSPHTVGAAPGGRNRPAQWLQEQLHQAGIVQGYVKWHYELPCAENLAPALQRAVQIAATEPAGPVYLTLPREVLLQPAAVPGEAAAAVPIRPPAADPAALAEAAGWLLGAEQPVILTSYAGRHAAAVPALVRLAETLGAPVIESRHRMNFPSSHPLHLGFAAARHLPEADCVLVVDHDVPWVPAQCRPRAGARVIHIDIDPLKREIPLWGFPVDLAIAADAASACAALVGELERQRTPADAARIAARRLDWETAHGERKARLRERALALCGQRPIAPEWAAACLDGILTSDIRIVGEAVANSPVLWDHLTLDRPGSYFQSQGSGLGWGLGAALGVKLADPSQTVVCLTGDGSWIFGSPIAAYWAAQRCSAPFLTVVLANGAYQATKEAVAGLAPEGFAQAAGLFPACDLPGAELYAQLGEALGLWARTVRDPAELSGILRQGLEVTRAGRCALVSIAIGTGETGAPGGDCV